MIELTDSCSGWKLQRICFMFHCEVQQQKRVVHIDNMFTSFPQCVRYEYMSGKGLALFDSIQYMKMSIQCTCVEKNIMTFGSECFHTVFVHNPQSTNCNEEKTINILSHFWSRCMYVSCGKPLIALIICIAHIWMRSKQHNYISVYIYDDEIEHLDES